jgi:hypothetical protein
MHRPKSVYQAVKTPSYPNALKQLRRDWVKSFGAKHRDILDELRNKVLAQDD